MYRTVEPTYPCSTCGLALTRADADYHRGQCHAFAQQTRDELEEDDLRDLCPVCDGTGIDGEDFDENCDGCAGTGKVW